ncbi:MAG TPA: SIS domain-containing protein [Burkholderiaceae bacterium]
MNWFGMAADTLESLDATWTASEIFRQPAVWGMVEDSLLAQQHAIARFLQPLLATKSLRIVLTGAGTSAYVGDILAPALMRHLGLRVESIATTDLVTGPDRYLQRDVPTLLVSFARSGDSPESAAALTLANARVGKCHHLVITCNHEGALSRLSRSLPQSAAYTFTLPDATHDRAFAMTSSFSSMLLAAAAIFGLIPTGSGKSARWAMIRNSASALIERFGDTHRDILNAEYKRVVYLGSNEMHGLARESALKLLELTDGNVASFCESPLGFRHGPKSLIDSTTLVVVFLSNEPYTRQYDVDLLRELKSDGRAGRVLALGTVMPNQAADRDFFPIDGLTDAPDIELAPVFAIFAQVFAMFQALRIKNRPDHPSSSGTVNRVVKGVVIYPWEDEERADVSGY